MGKLVQICASSNDLFGLDEEGNVHQYDFNTKAWVKLAHGPRETPGLADDAATTGHRDAWHSPR
ncbi:MAG: hypothetical protein HYU51_17880 [Candidatus Rokubacteria bacterium]|nr:hypothetical protein [Candidatus Rokubacteria bacterium]